MVAFVKAFGYGAEESFNALVDNSVIIIISTASSAGIGYLIGGASMAWVAAKVTSLVLGAAFAIDPSTVETDLKSLSHRTARSVGNIVSSLWIPYCVILVLQRIARP